MFSVCGPALIAPAHDTLGITLVCEDFKATVQEPGWRLPAEAFMTQPLLVAGNPMSPQVTLTDCDTFEHGGDGGVTPNGTALKQVASP
jgi:hypothetical protein